MCSRRTRPSTTASTAASCGASSRPAATTRAASTSASATARSGSFPTASTARPGSCLGPAPTDSPRSSLDGVPTRPAAGARTHGPRRRPRYSLALELLAEGFEGALDLLGEFPAVLALNALVVDVEDRLRLLRQTLGVVHQVAELVESHGGFRAVRVLGHVVGQAGDRLQFLLGHGLVRLRRGLAGRAPNGDAHQSEYHSRAQPSPRHRILPSLAALPVPPVMIRPPRASSTLRTSSLVSESDRLPGSGWYVPSPTPLAVVGWKKPTCYGGTVVRRLAAELFGTFALVFAGTGAITIND